jgi:glucose/arabinose dehydrogenase
MPRALICFSFSLILLTSFACLPTPEPAAQAPAATSRCAPAASDDDPAEDACPEEAPVERAQRHPPGGLPQILPTPAPMSPPPAAPLRVEAVADGLNMPLGLAWTPDGRKLFFSEVKLGQIRTIVDGVLLPQPFITLPIVKNGETGMLGLAVDPEYERNRYVYAYRSDPEQNRNQVLRFEDRDGQAANQTEILKTVAISERGGAHNGGRIAFGPDGMLYATVGNGQSTKVGQDPCKLGGKILRVNRDGGRAADMPFACTPSFALGFRNPFGMAFHPLTGALFVTDNGGKGRDELDLVRREGNYGHPVVEGIPNDPRFVDPLWESGPVSMGPTGLTFYTGDRLPEFKNDLFLCGVHTGQLSQVRLAAPSFDRVEAMSVEILRDQVDCRLDVASGPDGALYFTNFTRIGRITR